MKRGSDKKYLLGYRAEGVKLYRTNLRPVGYVVAGLGFVSLGIAVFPNGLSFVFYPLGFGLLGLVGIRFSIRDLYNRFEFTRRFL